jgi:hypothetical protein
MRFRTVTLEMWTSAGDALEGRGRGEAGLMVATSKEGSGSLAWMICAEEAMARPKHVAATSKRRVQFCFEAMPQVTLQ